jgi:hypothetical protein
MGRRKAFFFLTCAKVLNWELGKKDFDVDIGSVLSGKVWSLLFAGVLGSLKEDFRLN